MTKSRGWDDLASNDDEGAVVNNPQRHTRLTGNREQRWPFGHLVVMPLAREILIYIYVSSIVLAGALASKIALQRL